jgi:Rv2525c-like, glycoside hydrolase-like domain
VRGIDYAWSHPGGAAIRAAGYGFVMRYLSRDASKNLTRAELADLRAHGLLVGVVWEGAAKDMLGGRAAGMTDARAAATQLGALGMADAFCYFAADWDAAPGEQAAIDAYLDGAASILGRAHIGIYGGYWPTSRALTAGKASKSWQTYAWSGGHWDARCSIRQGVYVRVGGVECDVNESFGADSGFWPRPPAPKPPPAPPPVPGHATQPTAVHATARYTNATLTWGGATHVTGYWVDIVDDATGDHVHPQQSLPPTAASWIFRGLHKGHTYRLGVYARPGAPGTHSTWRTVTTRT